MSVRETIEAKLAAALAPDVLVVVDESAQHAGHVGAAAFTGGETHFRVKVIAAAFTGQSRIQRHRTINTLLAEELAGGVHALAIEAAAPEDRK